MRIVVFVPSRGRPAGAARAIASILGTAAGAVSALVLVDGDDPMLEDYRALDLPVWVVEPGGRFTGALNHAAAAIADGYDVMGAFGDDVIFRTRGWDGAVADTLATPGIAYGDDLIHGIHHPTAVFMSTEVYRALGWLALPVTRHQWADDGWKRLGKAAGVLRYMPTVIVEHMHPAVGKAPWDAGYDRVFDPAVADDDFQAFTAWASEGGLEADADKVRAIL